MTTQHADIGRGDLVRATDATKEILDEIGLESYLFEVEPSGSCWQVKLEFSTSEGAWQALTLSTPTQLLQGSLDDREAHEQLLREWAERLSMHDARMHDQEP